MENEISKQAQEIVFNRKVSKHFRPDVHFDWRKLDLNIRNSTFLTIDIKKFILKIFRPNFNSL